MSGRGGLFSEPERVVAPSFFILIADDMAANRALLKRFITEHFKKTTLSVNAIHFVQAIHGGEAYDAVKNKLEKDHTNFDIIIMDINMRPEVPHDGLQATREIRKLEEDYIEKDKLNYCDKAYIIRYSSEEPLPSESELVEQGFNAMLNKDRTKPAEVSRALKEATKNNSNIKDHEELNRSLSPQPKK